MGRVAIPERLNPLFDLLNRFSKRRAALDIPSDYLEMFRGKASVLCGNPRYAPYRADYLLEAIH
jgi:hypothetical protein